MSRRLTLAHPSQKRLREWLQHGAPESGGARGARVDDAVTAHVEQCERCADRLVAMAFADDDIDEQPLSGDLKVALREAFEPPADINTRVLHAIDERQRADNEASLVFGLFSIATDIADLLLPDANRRRTPEDEASTGDGEDSS